MNDKFREELKNSRLLPSAPDQFLFHYKDTPNKIFSADFAMGIKYVINKVPADGEFYGHYTELSVNTLVDNGEWVVVDSSDHFADKCELLESRIANLEKWLRELIVDVDTEDFANLDIETTLDAYGLPPIKEKK